VSRSPDKDRLIRELGADSIVRDGEGLGSAGGADVVLGTSNSADAMDGAVKGLRPDVRLVVMGFEPKPLPLSIEDLIMRRIRVLGSQQNGREYLYEALRFAAEGKVKVLAETYPLAEVGRAYERVEAGQVRFRAVVTS
jgi:alcohol dehydrogenase